MKKVIKGTNLETIGTDTLMLDPVIVPDSYDVPTTAAVSTAVVNVLDDHAAASDDEELTMPAAEAANYTVGNYFEQDGEIWKCTDKTDNGDGTWTVGAGKVNGVVPVLNELNDTSDALQEQIDDIAEKAGSGYTPKGPASVATLNGLTGQENGWLYTMTDAGTLTDGSLAVTAGDTVAWDATNGVWYKAMDYAPRQYGTNEINNLPTTITNFRSGDYIAVGGTTPAKMSKDDLLWEAAENAVNSGVAAGKGFVDNINSDINKIEVSQNLKYSLAASTDGYPIISGGKITGYDSSIYWAHSIIDKGNGLFVGFITTSEKTDYIWYIDDNGVIIGKYTIVSPTNTIVRKVPLDFPQGATKAVVLSGILGATGIEKKVYLWEYVGISGESKFSLDNFKKLSVKSTTQNTSDGSAKFNSYGIHTGYNSETYWKHVEISSGVGKFVSFYCYSSATYIYYLDSDNVKIGQEDFSDSQTFISKFPLNFPPNAVKAIVLSRDNPAGRGEIVLHELCGLDGTNEDVYNTIYTLNPELEAVPFENEEGQIQKGNGYVLSTYATGNGWYHVIIDKQEGLYVNFNVNTTNVPAIIYVDDSRKIIKEELFSGSSSKAFTGIPIVFPEGATKCYVQSHYGAVMYQKVKVFKPKSAYLPSYWNEAIESYAHAISEETRKVENGCAFIFVTDIHFGEYNENHAGRIIHKLLEKTSVPFAVCGGDFVYAIGEDVDEFEKALTLTREFIGDIGKDRLFCIRGNHDFSMHYGNASSPDGAILAKAGTNDYLLSNLRPNVVLDKEHTCYYYDDNYSGTRFIFVNSCDDYVASDDYESVTEIGYAITTDQLQFIADAVEDADGKHVVVISHIAADSALSDYSSSQLPIHNLLVAAKDHTTFSSGSVTKDFSTWTGTIVMQLSGHAHKDEDAFTDGILSVLTDCDCRLHTGRIIGTTLEQCFDVFIVDYDAHTVKTIRIGAGSDRTLSY